MTVTFHPDVEGVLRDIGRAAGAAHAEAWAVGGVVRDALLGRRAHDIDVSIVGDVDSLVRSLKSEWHATLEQHDAFSTATLLRPDELQVDFARARSEVYERPGALPAVTPAALAEDLRRRDFTVNAIAADLCQDAFGALVDVSGGVEDLHQGVLRILHEGSFVDDPTRLFRAARYAVRLGLAPDAATDAAARDAVTAGALATLSPDRRRREVELLLVETLWADIVAWLNEWGVWRALTGGWEPAAGLLKRVDVARAWAIRVLCDEPPPPEALRWGFLLAAAPPELATALSAKPYEARTAKQARSVAASLESPDSPAWWRAMDAHPLLVMLVAVALSTGDSEKQRLTRYMEHIRPVVPAITGDDLVAEGAEAGPSLGAALRETLDAVREGRVTGHDEQLHYAMDCVRQRSR